MQVIKLLTDEEEEQQKINFLSDFFRTHQMIIDENKAEEVCDSIYKIYKILKKLQTTNYKI